MVHHTKRQLMLAFSQLLPIHDGIHMTLLEIVFNGGKPFEAVFQGKFLDGVDPIGGIIVKTAQNVIFVEGTKRTETGVRFVRNNTPQRP
jgi:hypothetical protein